MRSPPVANEASTLGKPFIKMVQTRDGAANSEYLQYLRLCTEVWRRYKATRCRGESVSPPSPPKPGGSPETPAKRRRTTFDLGRRPQDASDVLGSRDSDVPP